MKPSRGGTGCADTADLPVSSHRHRKRLQDLLNLQLGLIQLIDEFKTVRHAMMRSSGFDVGQRSFQFAKVAIPVRAR